MRRGKGAKNKVKIHFDIQIKGISNLPPQHFGKHLMLEWKRGAHKENRGVLNQLPSAAKNTQLDHLISIESTIIEFPRLHKWEPKICKFKIKEVTDNKRFENLFSGELNLSEFAKKSETLHPIEKILALKPAKRSTLKKDVSPFSSSDSLPTNSSGSLQLGSQILFACNLQLSIKSHWTRINHKKVVKKDGGGDDFDLVTDDEVSESETESEMESDLSETDSAMSASETENSDSIDEPDSPPPSIPDSGSSPLINGTKSKFSKSSFKRSTSKRFRRRAKSEREPSKSMIKRDEKGRGVEEENTRVKELEKEIEKRDVVIKELADKLENQIPKMEEIERLKKGIFELKSFVTEFEKIKNEELEKLKKENESLKQRLAQPASRPTPTPRSLTTSVGLAGWKETIEEIEKKFSAHFGPLRLGTSGGNIINVIPVEKDVSDKERILKMFFDTKKNSGIQFTENFHHYFVELSNLIYLHSKNLENYKSVEIGKNIYVLSICQKFIKFLKHYNSLLPGPTTPFNVQPGEFPGIPEFLKILTGIIKNEISRCVSSHDPDRLTFWIVYLSGISYLLKTELLSHSSSVAPSTTLAKISLIDGMLPVPPLVQPRGSAQQSGMTIDMFVWECKNAELLAYKDLVKLCMKDIVKANLYSIVEGVQPVPSPIRGRTATSTSSSLNSSDSSASKKIILVLNKFLKSWKKFILEESSGKIFIEQFFYQIYNDIDVELFNYILRKKELCYFGNGFNIKFILSELLTWISSQGDLLNSITKKASLSHIMDASNVLTMASTNSLTNPASVRDAFPSLKPQQVMVLLNNYTPGPGVGNDKNVSQSLKVTVGKMSVESGGNHAQDIELKKDELVVL